MGSVELGFRDLARIRGRRVVRALQRRLVRLYDVIGRRGRELPASDRSHGRAAEGSRAPERPRFAAGNIVEVLSYAEISVTLDANRSADGLSFMEGMRRYCGQRLKVLKKVELIFDETAGRMVRMTRDRYILEGAICDGVGTFDKEGCDRCCFYFWSGLWLRNVR